MTEPYSRRDWIKTVGAVSAGALVPLDPALGAPAASPRVVPAPLAVRQVYAPGDIVELYSTSEVFTPPRGRSFMKFSFDFPEPAVVFGDHRFSILLFTDENTYSLDRSLMRATGNGDALELTCTGLVWAGGQEKAPGKVTVKFARTARTIAWDIVAEMSHPIKTVTTVIRDVPRGQVSLGGAPLGDTRDGDVLGGYTFGAGDLHGAGTPQSMTTAVSIVQAGDTDFFYLTTQDTRVRPKRYYFQAGERAFRTEAIYEHDAWRNDTRVVVPRWQLGHASSFEGAMAPHIAHIEKAFNLPSWDSRTDVPAWMRNIAMVTTLHGMHYTGFIFNDYARQLAILRWMATQIPADRVLVFLASWDGRYYWDYPNYTVPARMGGEAGFHQLIGEARKLGFRMMPMFGTNAANRRQSIWPRIASGATRKIDGDIYNLNWVDWNNDRHQDGWLTYMNLGEDKWRHHMEGRIADIIGRFGADAYFLDIVGGHVNSTNGDMHDGTRRLVKNLRERFPQVVGVGEMPYDALYEFIPLYHAGGGERWRKYARFFQHLSAPAPGRGSSGVHESGFGRFNSETLGLSPSAIPTLQVVDDTFTKHKDTMSAIIAKAKARGGDRMSAARGRARSSRRGKPAGTGKPAQRAPLALRKAVCNANVELARRGLALFTFGNASAIDRGSGLVMIKPSGVPYEELKPSDLVVTDLEGRVVEGKLRPSSDLATHLELYREWPSIGAVVHTHSHFATVWAQAGQEIPCYGTTHADYFNGPVPVTRAMTAAEIAQEYERNTGRVIVERFDGEPNTMSAVLVAGHASFVWASTIEAAVETASVLEEVARMAFHTAVLNPATEQISQALLHKHFRRKHGPSAYYGQKR